MSQQDKPREISKWAIGWNEDGGWSVANITGNKSPSGIYVVDLDDYEKLEAALRVATEALYFNVSKHNEWIDKGHWCDSKRVLQSVTDSSKSAIERIRKVMK